MGDGGKVKARILNGQAADFWDKAAARSLPDSVTRNPMQSHANPMNTSRQMSYS